MQAPQLSAVSSPSRPLNAETQRRRDAERAQRMGVHPPASETSLRASPAPALEDGAPTRCDERAVARPAMPRRDMPIGPPLRCSAPPRLCASAFFPLVTAPHPHRIPASGSAVISPSRPRGRWGVVNVACVLALSVAACAHRGPPAGAVAPGWRQEGLATWYGEPYHGRRTASGEVYDMYGVSAAHPSLPFGTEARVTRSDTGAAVEVRINDRGPFVGGRIIDLSYGAARRIGLDRDGVAPVLVEVVGEAAPPTSGATPPLADCYWVQVGAFSELENARRSRQRLEQLGEAAVVSEGPRALLRVRAGPFPTRAAAEAALARVQVSWPEARVFSCQEPERAGG
jgi:rare lipoprotein A